MADKLFGVDYDIPPVKIGDRVYWYDEMFCHTHRNHFVVSAIHISNDYKRSHIVIRPELMPSLSKNLPFYKYNKTWFLNENDVLKALNQEDYQMIRTLSNCSLITKMKIKPQQKNGKCEGFAKSEYDDEPCEICKECRLNEFYEED